MPDFLDPMKLLGYFGTWALVGLLVVIFVESGVLFPILPGDSLLFVAGMLAAGTAALAEEGGEPINFQLWQLLVFIPIAAILGGQVGYWIGRNIGTAMFKPDAKILKQKYLDEAHVFFEQRGPFAIVIARFVPIVRTLAPLTAGRRPDELPGVRALQHPRRRRVGRRPDAARVLAGPVRDHPETPRTDLRRDRGGVRRCRCSSSGTSGAGRPRGRQARPP